MRQKLILVSLLIGLLTSCIAEQLQDQAPDISPTSDGDLPILSPSGTSQPPMTSTPLSSPITTMAPSPSSEAVPPMAIEPVPFSRLRMINTMEGWAYSASGIWQTTDGGLTWVDGTPQDYVYFQYALDAQTAWATISTPDDDNSPILLVRTTDGGVSWTLIFEQTWQMFSQYKFYDTMNGLLYECGAAAGTGICTIYETDDGGLSFTPLEYYSDHQGYPQDTPGRFLFCNICGDAFAFDLDRLVLVGGNLVQFPWTTFPVWSSLDRGQTWHYQELSVPDGIFNPALIDPYQPTFFGDLEGILPVKLASESYDQFGVAFYISQDGGTTWRFQSLVDLSSAVDQWSRFDYINNKEMVFTCGPDLCVTRDGAQTWQRFSTNLPFNYTEGQDYIQQFDFVSSLIGYALAGLDSDQLTLWKTIDGGESWQLLSPEIHP